MKKIMMKGEQNSYHYLFKSCKILAVYLMYHFSFAVSGDNFEGEDNDNEDDNRSNVDDDEQNGDEIEGEQMDVDENGGDEDSTGSTEDLFNVDESALEEKLMEMYANVSGEVLEVSASPIISFKGQHFAVIFVGAQDPCWYNICDLFKTGLICLLQANKKPVPLLIESLSEHKLRIEYSRTNEMQFRTNNQKYPVTRWSMVTKLNAVNPEHHLELELKKFSKLFKQMYSERPTMSPGRRWINFVTNGNREGILSGCQKYMGNDLSNVERVVNGELLALGKKNHIYHHGCNLDKFWTDGKIKSFLQTYLGAGSWDDLTEDVKSICYKHYPERDVPSWNAMMN